MTGGLPSESPIYNNNFKDPKQGVVQVSDSRNCHIPRLQCAHHAAKVCNLRSVLTDHKIDLIWTKKHSLQCHLEAHHTRLWDLLSLLLNKVCQGCFLGCLARYLSSFSCLPFVQQALGLAKRWSSTCLLQAATKREHSTSPLGP